MVTYQNLKTGRQVQRPTTDRSLEASSGWFRVEDDPAPEPESVPDIETSSEEIEEQDDETEDEWQR